MVSLSTRATANAGCECRLPKEKGSKGFEFRLIDGIADLDEVPRLILAATRTMRTENPATSYRKRPETARERFLSFDEIQRLAESFCAAPDQAAAGIIRLCMLTGARYGKARTATFDQFNLNPAIWTKQDAYIKQRRVHRVPISARPWPG